METTLRISLKLDFTPNNLGCFGLQIKKVSSIGTHRFIQGRLERTKTNLKHFIWGVK